MNRVILFRHQGLSETARSVNKMWKERELVVVTNNQLGLPHIFHPMSVNTFQPESEDIIIANSDESHLLPYVLYRYIQASIPIAVYTTQGQTFKQWPQKDIQATAVPVEI